MAFTYANVSDLTTLKSLSAQELEASADLIQYASSLLYTKAEIVGVDLDAKVESSEAYAIAVKAVVVQAVLRALSAISGNDNINLSQMSQSAMGYSISMSYSNASKAVYFLDNELKELGLTKKQVYGGLDLYEYTSPWGYSDPKKTID